MISRDDYVDALISIYRKRMMLFMYWNIFVHGPL